MVSCCRPSRRAEAQSGMERDTQGVLRCRPAAFKTSGTKMMKNKQIPQLSFKSEAEADLQTAQQW